jgi:two-component system sensor histidine kinase HydH
MKAFTSLLVGSLPIGVIATNNLGLIATWNNTITEMTGIGKERASNRKPSELLPQRLSDLFTACEDDKVKKIEQVEIIELLNNKNYVLLCQIINILDHDKKSIGKMLLLTDITEIKRLEQKMRESEKLAAIGKVAGGVAHEVRNPLSSIKGLALLLKNKFSDGSEEQKTADLLIQETERMNRTISEMMSLTRSASLSLAPIDIEGLLHEQLTLLQAEIKERNISVVFDVEQRVEPVLGDRDRLIQVIINILLNSIQAMEEGGVLTLKCTNMDSGTVHVVVSDNGPGMTNEILDQVFDPYFTTKKEGSGIGLSISQKIVTDHGGRISIESELGQGTWVTIELPVA